MHSYVILCEKSNGRVRLLIAIIFHELSVFEKHMFWTTYVAQNHKEIPVVRERERQRTNGTSNIA